MMRATSMPTSASSRTKTDPSGCRLVAAEHVRAHFPGAVGLAPIDDQVFAPLVGASPTCCWRGEAVLTDAVRQLPRHLDEGGVEGDISPTSIKHALPELADRLGAADQRCIRRQQL